MENQLFQLKFTAKQLQLSAKKCSKAEKQEIEKLKKALQQGNTEGAKIYSANAIRKKTEALNFLRLSSRVDAVASRVETAVQMRKVTQNMKNVVKGMDKAMQSMNLEQIGAIMDRFESTFEDLDVGTQYMEGTIGQTTAQTTPQDQVEELMQRVADENGLELSAALPGAGSTQIGTATVEKEQDELNERLAKLRNS
ncbi:Charged multivesicular body protein 1a [Nowakowskiella sp. JEL0407]|nr:Charged multivesicular body protein 1a [Nowakowskiella sp. JEL0407]